MKGHSNFPLAAFSPVTQCPHGVKESRKYCSKYSPHLKIPYCLKKSIQHLYTRGGYLCDKCLGYSAPASEQNFSNAELEDDLQMQKTPNPQTLKKVVEIQK